MKRFLFSAALLCGGIPYAIAAQKPAAVVRRVSVLGAGNHVELEIDTTQPIAPQTLVVSNPFRLVVDFPGAKPGNTLRNLKINRGEVKDVRVGLFAANPPTTRIVLDLISPQPYQVFPSGRSVILKIGGNSLAPASTPGPDHAAQAVPAISTVAQSAPTPPPVQVDFQNGALTIQAHSATLAQVLREIHRQTGAEIAIPPAAEQEQVIADYGPGPASQVLAALLNGSPFDFVLVGSEHDPNRLTSILLTPRGSGPDTNSQFYPAVTNPPADANADSGAVSDSPPESPVEPDMQQPSQ